MTSTNASQHAKRIAKTTVILSILSIVGVAAAQNTGSSFCSTDMAATIQNIIRVLIYGGPLIGGTIFIGSVIGIPIANRSDWKKRLKEKRNLAIIRCETAVGATFEQLFKHIESQTGSYPFYYVKIS